MSETYCLRDRDGDWWFGYSPDALVCEDDPYSDTVSSADEVAFYFGPIDASPTHGGAR